MAASVWWVVLSLTWVLAAASKWSTEAIASYANHFHFVGWLIPAGQTVIVMVFNAIDGDPITGLCYVGNTDVTFLRMYNFVIHIFIVYYNNLSKFCRYYNYFQVQKQHPGLGNASKLTNLMTKIGTFSVLYTLPALFVILALFYEQHYRPLWEQSLMCFCADRNNHSGHTSSTAKYQPADILYAKSDISAPHFYNTALRQSHMYGGIPDKL
uniref:G_PROTEIN_RECEP_F2_4 domain-containing protein n=1 Tax=Heterorhabditis bacteriophora TaxID=37862 RepID=A0A1I7X3P0_HETBA